MKVAEETTEEKTDDVVVKETDTVCPHCKHIITRVNPRKCPKCEHEFRTADKRINYELGADCEDLIAEHGYDKLVDQISNRGPIDDFVKECGGVPDALTVLKTIKTRLDARKKKSPK